MQNININLIENNTGQLDSVPQNPRDLTNDGFELAKKSIAEFPEMLQVRTLVVVPKDNKYVTIGGNQRLRAMRDLGYTEAPCVVVDWNSDQIQRFIIADNIEYGVWNYDMLANDWDTEQLIEWGLDLPNYEEPEVKGLTDEDDVPELPPEPVTKLGDLWLLGEHRLLCGDSTSIDDVEKLMNGKKADMVFTDPPYGMKKEKLGVLNDNLNYNELLEFNRKWIPLSFAYTKENGSWYCWGIDEPLIDIYSNILKPMGQNQQITFRNLITWNKGSGQGQNSENTRSYAIADEKCLFVMCGVQGFNNNSDNYYEGWEPIRQYLCDEWNKISDKKNWNELLGNQMGKHYFTKSQWCLPTKEIYQKLQQLGKDYFAFQKDYFAFQKDYSIIKKEYDKIKQQYYKTRSYFNNTHDNFNNVWHFDRHIKTRVEGNHATPKPIPLCARAILSSSQENEIVFDLFGGSGSTLIACEKTNRISYNIELDPKYCDVIIKRWQEYTGKQAVLKSTKQTFNELLLESSTQAGN